MDYVIVQTSRLVPLSFKKILYFTGGCLALSGLGFVLMRLRVYGSDIDVDSFSLNILLIISMIAIIYGMSNIMIALAWWNLLVHVGVKTSPAWAIKFYGISQIAKYVPGNIFHFAGRQVHGRTAGIKQWLLAKSTLWELGLLAITGSFFGLLVIPLLFDKVPLVLGVSFFVIVINITLIFFVKIFSVSLSKAFLWYIGFFIVSGILFTCLIELFTEQLIIGNVNILLLIGAYVIAWLLGFVSPGAPAGLGIREMVLFFLLKGVIDETDLLLVLVLGRIVTAIGDVVFFILATIMKPSKQQ